MAREYFWNIRVDGSRHEILARDKGNSFDVYVDDQFRFSIRSDINLDIEEDLTVGTKRCRIVVYRGVPDLAVDGILLDAEAKLLKEERRNRRFTRLAAILLMVLGVGAIWAWTLIYLSGETHFGGFMGPVLAALAFGAGVWLMLRSLRKGAL